MAPVQNISSYSASTSSSLSSSAASSSSSSASSTSDSSKTTRQNIRNRRDSNDYWDRFFPITSKVFSFDDSFFENSRSRFDLKVKSLLDDWDEEDLKADAWFKRSTALDKRFGSERQLEFLDERYDNNAFNYIEENSQYKMMVDVGDVKAHEIKLKIVGRRELAVERRMNGDSNNFRYFLYLPEDTNMEAITSVLSSDNMLTIVAPKMVHSSVSQTSGMSSSNNSKISLRNNDTTNLVEQTKEKINYVCKNCEQNSKTQQMTVNNTDSQSNMKKELSRSDAILKIISQNEEEEKDKHELNTTGSESHSSRTGKEEFVVEELEEKSVRSRRGPQNLQSKESSNFCSTPSSAIEALLRRRGDAFSTISSSSDSDGDFQVALKNLLSKRDQQLSVKKSVVESHLNLRTSEKENRISKMAEDDLYYMFAMDVQDFIPDGDISVSSVGDRELDIKCQGTSGNGLASNPTKSFTERLVLPEDSRINSAQASLTSSEGLLIIIVPKKNETTQRDEHVIPIGFGEIRNKTASEEESPTRINATEDDHNDQKSSITQETVIAPDVMCNLDNHLSSVLTNGVSSVHGDDSVSRQSGVLNQIATEKASKVETENSGYLDMEETIQQDNKTANCDKVIEILSKANITESQEQQTARTHNKIESEFHIQNSEAKNEDVKIVEKDTKKPMKLSLTSVVSSGGTDITKIYQDSSSNVKDEEEVDSIFTERNLNSKDTEKYNMEGKNIKIEDILVDTSKVSSQRFNCDIDQGFTINSEKEDGRSIVLTDKDSKEEEEYRHSKEKFLRLQESKQSKVSSAGLGSLEAAQDITYVDDGEEKTELSHDENKKDSQCETSNMQVISMDVLEKGSFFKDLDFEDLKMPLLLSIREIISSANIDYSLSEDELTCYRNQRTQGPLNSQEALSLSLEDESHYKFVLDVFDITDKQSIKVMVLSEREIEIRGQLPVKEGESLQHFSKYFVLSEDADIQSASSLISTDGFLLITFPKKISSINKPSKLSSTQLEVDNTQENNVNQVVESLITDISGTDIKYSSDCRESSQSLSHRNMDTQLNISSSRTLDGESSTDSNSMALDSNHQNISQDEGRVEEEDCRRETKLLRSLESSLSKVSSEEIGTIQVSSDISNTKDEEEEMNLCHNEAKNDYECDNSNIQVISLEVLEKGFLSEDLHFKDLKAPLLSAIREIILSENIDLSLAEDELTCYRNLRSRGPLNSQNAFVLPLEDESHYKFVMDVYDVTEKQNIKIMVLNEKEIKVEGQLSTKNGESFQKFSKCFTISENSAIESASSFISKDGFLFITIPKKISSVSKYNQLDGDNTHQKKVNLKKVDSLITDDISGTDGNDSVHSTDSMQSLSRKHKDIQLDISSSRTLEGKSSTVSNSMALDSTHQSILQEEEKEEDSHREAEFLRSQESDIKRVPLQGHETIKDSRDNINVRDEENIELSYDGNKKDSGCVTSNMQFVISLEVFEKGFFFEDLHFEDMKTPLLTAIREIILSENLDLSLMEDELTCYCNLRTHDHSRGQVALALPIEDESHYKFVLDVHGVTDKQAIKVMVLNEREIRVEGQFPVKEGDSESLQHFSKCFVLSDDAAIESASSFMSKDGFLLITIPKKKSSVNKSTQLENDNTQEKKVNLEVDSLIIDDITVVDIKDSTDSNGLSLCLSYKHMDNPIDNCSSRNLQGNSSTVSDYMELKSTYQSISQEKEEDEGCYSEAKSLRSMELGQSKVSSEGLEGHDSSEVSQYITDVDNEIEKTELSHDESKKDSDYDTSNMQVISLEILEKGLFSEVLHFEDLKAPLLTAIREIISAENIDISLKEDELNCYRNLRTRGPLKGQVALTHEDESNYKFVLDVYDVIDKQCIKVMILNEREIRVEGQFPVKEGDSEYLQNFSKCFVLSDDAAIESASSLMTNDGFLLITIPKKVLTKTSLHDGNLETPEIITKVVSQDEDINEKLNSDVRQIQSWDEEYERKTVSSDQRIFLENSDSVESHKGKSQPGHIGGKISPCKNEDIRTHTDDIKEEKEDEECIVSLSLSGDVLEATTESISQSVDVLEKASNFNSSSLGIAKNDEDMNVCASSSSDKSTTLMVQERGQFSKDGFFDDVHEVLLEASKEILAKYGNPSSIGCNELTSYRSLLQHQDIQEEHRIAKSYDDGNYFKIIIDVSEYSMEREISVKVSAKNEILVECSELGRNEDDHEKSKIKIKSFVLPFNFDVESAISGRSSDGFLSIMFTKKINSKTTEMNGVKNSGNLQSDAYCTSMNPSENATGRGSISSGNNFEDEFITKSSNNGTYENSSITNHQYTSFSSGLSNIHTRRNGTNDRVLPISWKGLFFKDSSFQEFHQHFQKALEKVLGKSNEEGKRCHLSDIESYKCLRKENPNFDNEPFYVEDNQHFYEMALDVEGFIIVSVVENNLVVEEKRGDKLGGSTTTSSQHSKRYFTLPDGIDVDATAASLSSDGILVIVAPKRKHLGSEEATATTQS